MAIRSAKLIVIAAALAGLLLAGGCGESTSLITDLSASPISVVAGKTSVITCSTAKSGDLTYAYAWKASGGSFAITFGNPITWTSPMTPGIYQVTATVTRSDGVTASETINLTVVSSDQASDSSPIINTLTASPATGAPGFSSTLTCSASNRGSSTTESSSLTYAWSATGGTLGSTIGTAVTWTAPAATGTYVVTVKVSNGTYTTTGTLNLLVTNDSSTSVIKVTSLSYSPTTLYGGDAATLTCAATDSGGYDLTYAWSATAGTLTSTIGSSVGWTAPTTEGTYQAIVNISDTASNKTSQILSIVVKKQVSPPVISNVSASPNPVSTSSSASVACVATDPNNLTMTCSWSATSGTFSPTTGMTSTWTAPAVAGTYSITATVSNGKLSATYTIPIVVN